MDTRCLAIHSVGNEVLNLAIVAGVGTTIAILYCEGNDKTDFNCEGDIKTNPLGDLLVDNSCQLPMK